jgi:pyruvate,water dikinase
MYYSTVLRNLLLRLGECLVDLGTLTAPEDIFFLTMEEQGDLVSGKGTYWRKLVTRRQAERAEWMKLTVPDTIRGWQVTDREKPSPSEFAVLLQGVPISSGVVTGPARVVRSAADWVHVRPGDIVIVPVIDPGMAPLFGIAAGLVAELGGTLSHGAIIAREYGLPAVVNVSGAMRLLADGKQITLNADAGHVCRAHTSVR